MDEVEEAWRLCTAMQSAWDATPKSLPDANGFYPIAVPGKTVAV